MTPAQDRGRLVDKKQAVRYKKKRGRRSYLHFWATMFGPYSSHSSFEIQSWWNVPSEARIEPPSHDEKRRSVGWPEA